MAKLALSFAGIPTLIVLDPQGEVITRQGRVEVLNDEDCRGFPWHPKPVLELSDSNAVQLNEGPCLVLFVGRKLSCGPRVGQNGQSSLGGQGGSVPAASFSHQQHKAWAFVSGCRASDPGDLFMLLPCGGCAGSCCSAFLLAAPGHQLGRRGQAGRKPWAR